MTTVSIQGIRGSYSEEAAREICGDGAFILECGTFDDALSAVSDGRAEFAVLPQENKIVGDIRPVHRLIEDGRFELTDRIRLAVDHLLVGATGAAKMTVRTVTSHPEAIKQCRRYLTGNPHWLCMAGADTAESVRKVVQVGKPSHAAIGSRRAAEIYGAVIIAEGIADEMDNWTEFALISAKK